MSSRREQARRLAGYVTGMQSGSRAAAADDVGDPTPCMPESPRRSVCEAHDPTGEPGAGNRHAGYGEQGLET